MASKEVIPTVSKAPEGVRARDPVEITDPSAPVGEVEVMLRAAIGKRLVRS
jgi:hypothetical protein